MPDLNGRPYTRTRTGIDDLEKLREVQQSLVRQDAIDRLRQRAQIRREYATPPFSQPVVSLQSPAPTTSDAPYQVDRYDPDSDRWVVRSVANPSEQFLAKALKTGGIETGSLVRGYPPTAIENQPKGRRFPPIEDPKTPKSKEITVTIQIGYTGRI